MDAHDLIGKLKELALELGHTPSRREFETHVKGGYYKLTQFGGFTALLQAAGLSKDIKSAAKEEKRAEKLVRQYKALCSKREQIHGFFRNVIDLDVLFERAGNPEVLKLSAQPDTHAKYADRKALNCYMKFLEYFKPDVHLIMGDFVDCEGLSHWPADTLEPRRIVPELKIARQILQELVDATPTASSRLFLTGNHEAWIDQAFLKMPELFDGLADLDIEISIKTLLGLPKFGYELYPLNELVQIGKAHFTHGIYTGNNHAQKHLNTFKTNIYYGHLHDKAQASQTSMEGPMEAASLGCLARLDAKFLKGKPNNWVHSHGVFEFFRDGTYTFYSPNIINGRMAYNGMTFQG